MPSKVKRSIYRCKKKSIRFIRYLYESIDTIRGVHGSDRLGFGLNPKSTRLYRVEGRRTRRRPRKTTSRVGSGSGGRRLDPTQSKDRKQRRNLVQISQILRKNL